MVYAGRLSTPDAMPGSIFTCSRTRPARRWRWSPRPRWRSSTMPRSSAISGRWSARGSISTGSWRTSPPIPGLVLYTLVNDETRAPARGALPRARPAARRAARRGDRALEDRARRSRPRPGPGRQHVMDEAYFARVDAIQFTIAHDDGIAWEDWEEADIVLAGVSRTLEDADQHLSRQPRLQGRQHPARGRKPAAAGAVRAQAAAGGRADHRAASG